jgi:hypothetical protein
MALWCYIYRSQPPLINPAWKKYREKESSKAGGLFHLKSRIVLMTGAASVTPEMVTTLFARVTLSCCPGRHGGRINATRQRPATRVA